MAVPRSVLITGTSTGIGRACAKRLAENGFRVFASVRREEDALSLVEETRGDVTPLTFDIAEDTARDRAVEQLRDQLDGAGLDGLVNNAGAMTPGPLEFFPLKDFRRYIEVNLIGTVALTQSCIPLLRETRGRIINIGSAQDRLTPPFFGPYTISKWGMRGLHQILRLELRPWGIECVLIVPGAIQTAIWKSLPTWQEDFERFPKDAQELYGELSESIHKTATNLSSSGIPADRVAEAVERALVAKRPKPEVTVGNDAKFMMTPIGALPTRLRERVMAAVFKLPKRRSAPRA